jgi:hypothetical protein
LNNRFEIEFFKKIGELACKDLDSLLERRIVRKWFKADPIKGIEYHKPLSQRTPQDFEFTPV